MYENAEKFRVCFLLHTAWKSGHTEGSRQLAGPGRGFLHRDRLVGRFAWEAAAASQLSSSPASSFERFVSENLKLTSDDTWKKHVANCYRGCRSHSCLYWRLHLNWFSEPSGSPQEESAVRSPLHRWETRCGARSAQSYHRACVCGRVQPWWWSPGLSTGWSESTLTHTVFVKETTMEMPEGMCVCIHTHTHTHTPTHTRLQKLLIRWQFQRIIWKMKTL